MSPTCYEFAMFGRFLPRETSFFDFFDAHAAKTVEGTKQFIALAAGTVDIVEGARRIKQIEHETDVITHQCVEALHRTFITPLERDDIHTLITRMDDIMDFVDSAAERMTLYGLTKGTPELGALADVLCRAAAEVERAVRMLRDMKNADRILASCVEINRMENEADGVLRGAVAKLFKEEKDPINIIKWKEVYENLEDATDRCEDVANIIEGVVLENA
jgi:uncharacterized protein